MGTRGHGGSLAGFAKLNSGSQFFVVGEPRAASSVPPLQCHSLQKFSLYQKQEELCHSVLKLQR